VGDPALPQQSLSVLQVLPAFTQHWALPLPSLLPLQTISGSPETAQQFDGAFSELQPVFPSWMQAVGPLDPRISPDLGDR